MKKEVEDAFADLGALIKRIGSGEFRATDPKVRELCVGAALYYANAPKPTEAEIEEWSKRMAEFICSEPD